MKKTSLVAAAIILAGLAVRLINISQPLLEFFPQRQTQTAEITRNIYVNGWPDFWTPKVRYFTNGEPIPYVLEFPLYNGLVAGLYYLFGPAVLWGRIISLIFFTGSSILFYKMIRSTFALTFFIFSPLHILTSRSFQPEEFALFLLLLAIYKKSWAVFSLAVLVKLPLALFAPVLFLVRRSRLHALLSIFPAALWYFRASRLTVHPAIARNFDLANWFQPRLWLDPKWYFSLFQIEHIWVLTTLGLLFFWLGLWASLRGAKRRGNLTLWLVWLISGISYLTIFNYHAATHEYYHLFLLPPLAVIAGLGLSSKRIATAGVIILITISLILPAVKKISSAPSSPADSAEITPDRYRMIENF